MDRGIEIRAARKALEQYMQKYEFHPQLLRELGGGYRYDGAVTFGWASPCPPGAGLTCDLMGEMATVFECFPKDGSWEVRFNYDCVDVLKRYGVIIFADEDEWLY